MDAQLFVVPLYEPCQSTGSVVTPALWFVTLAIRVFSLSQFVLPTFLVTMARGLQVFIDLSREPALISLISSFKLCSNSLFCLLWGWLTLPFLLSVLRSFPLSDLHFQRCAFPSKCGSCCLPQILLSCLFIFI